MSSTLGLDLGERPGRAAPAPAVSGAASLRGCDGSRSRSTPRRARDAGPGPTSRRRASRTWSPARRCSCRSARAAGRRSAWCLGEARAATPEGELRPIAARVRSDGPLLPPLSLAFAAVLADRYLAPLAVVIRAMLPPGMLERLELLAEVTPAGEAAIGAGRADAGRRARRRRPRPARRARRAGARRARPHDARGSRRPPAAAARRSRTGASLDLTWTLLGAAVGPRYERRAVDRPRPGSRRPRRSPPGTGPPVARSARARSRRWRELVATASPDGVAGGRRSRERHGSSAIAGLVRRGLRPRGGPRATPAPARGAARTGPRRAPAGCRADARAGRGPRPA